MGSPSPIPSSLGSLAQAARGKRLDRARWILLVVGVLTILVNAIDVARLRAQVKAEIAKEIREAGPGAISDPVLVLEWQEWEETTVRFGTLMGVGAIALGGAFVVFGFILKLYPVPVTILSFVLYVGAAAVFGLLDPATLVKGGIWKILIVTALIAAIKVAIAYEKARAATAAVEAKV
jgi:hypothetical protein